MKNKLLMTIVIPCYNGANFINNSIHSLINENIILEKITNLYEIIFVDDGSTDESLKIINNIAKGYNQKIRHNFIKVISKPNGQYGSTINVGLKEAKGKYFKVLDVDDIFDTDILIKIIYILSGLKKTIDVFLTDHVYEKIDSNIRIVQSLRKWFVPNIIYSTKNVKFPKLLITMHSIIYHTNFLKKIHFKQIEKVYYSDSQYSLVPLNWAKNFYYTNLVLYKYYIGREDQSINLNQMLKNRYHQLRVLKIILIQLNFQNINSKYISNYLIFGIRRMVQWAIMLIILDKKVKNKYQEIKKLFNLILLYQKKHFKKITSGLFLNIIKITHCIFVQQLLKISIKIYSKFKKNIMANWN